MQVNVPVKTGGRLKRGTWFRKEKARRLGYL